MDTVKDYARKWENRDPAETNTGFQWINANRLCIQERIQLRHKMKKLGSNPVNTPEVMDTLFSLGDKYWVDPDDKASNNIV